MNAQTQLSKTLQTRLDRLAPVAKDGKRIPKWIRCYDNGGETIDRYTVVYTSLRDGHSTGISMSGAPFHPQGVGQHFEYSRRDLIPSGQWAVDRPRYAHLGRKIAFSDLPEDCQTFILRDYAEIWNLPLDHLMATLPGPTTLKELSR